LDHTTNTLRFEWIDRRLTKPRKMKEVLDDFLDASEKTTTNKAVIAFALFAIMFIGSTFYNKYINVIGSRADLSVLLMATCMFIFLCIGLNLITVLIGRLFRRNKAKQASIKSKVFWLDRMIGGFIIWAILMFFMLADYFL